MQTHQKKKVEIIVEAPLLRAAIELIEQAGAKGYTVLPSRAGMGTHGPWESGQITEALHMELIIVIAEETVARRIMAEAYALLGDYTAIIYLSDVEVLRADHF